ncbi:MAG: bifunctional hydroxymethylpyrimidine kinase/phosphomethylpyrimidine kinase [Candidatus Thermoplasmatota archaeon]|nr:bifunctional hydroxymethylpyrimidine kinase/phosphomethylpyrimidine kinase [Candidatus Thermoplasmatota archaeon]
MEQKVALTIAGSDSSGGAGIQADLKAFAYLGVHGTTVVTCVTAQNTQHVHSIKKVPLSVINNQLDSVREDFPVAAVKTGMLYSKDIIKAVGKKLAQMQLHPVVDPVMVATSGDTLADADYVAALQKDILPDSLMITANIPEASALTGAEIRTRADVQNACKNLASFGPQYVLVKGGHFTDELVVDVLYDGKEFHKFILPRIAEKQAHGSGCTLSALITGLLAQGTHPVEAVQKAKHIVWGMIHQGYTPGKGADVLNHAPSVLVPPLLRRNDQFTVWLELTDAVQQLITMLPPWFIPEVGMNFVYALPLASTRDEVCAIDGRIIKHKERPLLCGTLEFGVSKHVASIVLAAMEFNPTIRSALNIRFTQKTVDLCGTIGLVIGTFERTHEPATAVSTMDWGTKQAITTLGRTPDIIYDKGGMGKEPMIRILGTNPSDVLMKVKHIINASIV